MTIAMRSDHFRSETETVTIRLERRLEYDATFMRDRFVYLARSGDRQGYSSLGIDPCTLREQQNEVMDVVRDHLPAMRRTAIDGALRLGYEEDLAELRTQARRQADEIRWLRRPLRDKAADFILNFWCQIKAVYS